MLLLLLLCQLLRRLGFLLSLFQFLSGFANRLLVFGIIGRQLQQFVGLVSESFGSIRNLLLQLRNRLFRSVFTNRLDGIADSLLLLCQSLQLIFLRRGFVIPGTVGLRSGVLWLGLGCFLQTFARLLCLGFCLLQIFLSEFLRDGFHLLPGVRESIGFAVLFGFVRLVGIRLSLLACIGGWWLNVGRLLFQLSGFVRDLFLLTSNHVQQLVVEFLFAANLIELCQCVLLLLQIRRCLSQFGCLVCSLSKLFTSGVEILFDNVLQPIGHLLLFALSFQAVLLPVVLLFLLLCKLFLLLGKLIQLSGQFHLLTSLINVFPNLREFVDGITE